MPLKPPRIQSEPTIADGDATREDVQDRPDWNSDAQTVREGEAPIIDPVMPRPVSAMEDDRPTQLYDREEAPPIQTSREQTMTGSTIGEVAKSTHHQLSRPLGQLISRAKNDLPDAGIDTQSVLKIRHDFEFDRRVGYHLTLTLYDPQGRCVQVSADLDQDGRAVRRGSLMAKLLSI